MDIRPTWTPEGWKLKRYYAAVDHENLEITVSYEKADEEYILSYYYIQTDDISAISTDFYQDGTGEYVKVKEDLEIYLTTNIDKPVAVWSTSNTFSSVTGPIRQEELIPFILGIQ